MRGRTLNDSFIILDESQNTTVEQMKMFLTRIGFNSKAVITGDITQIDLPRSTKSGLRHAIEVLEKVPELSFNYFDSKDIVRHPVVAKVVQAYEEWEVQDEIRRKEFAELRKSEREKERSEIYLKLSEKIQQENLALPLFQYTTPVYISPTIMGAKKNPVGVIYSKDLWRKVEAKAD